MPFADPLVCPSCRGPIREVRRCPRCGLDLTTEASRRLWQTLLQADALVAEAQAASQVAPAATAPPRPAPQAPTPPTAPTTPSAPSAPPSVPVPPSVPTWAPTYPAPGAPAHGPVSRPDRSWSVGTILLALGALGLVVAAVIFVTRSWEDLGLLGRTLVLLAVTALIGALGVWVTLRRLRASAEAVWSVFLVLLTIDAFAARHEGMLGLDAVAPSWACAVWGVVLLVVGVAIAVAARPRVSADLVAPSLVGGLGIGLAAIGTTAVPDDWRFFWHVFLGFVVAGLLGLAARPARLGVTTVTARVVVGLFFAAAYVAAGFELLDHPELAEVVGDLHGGPLLLMAIGSVVVAATVRPLRQVGVALAVVAVSGLVVVPAGAAWDPEGAWLAAAALAVLLGVATRTGTGDWVRGVRWGSAPVLLGLGFLVLMWGVQVVGAAGLAIDAAWDRSADSRLVVEGFPDVAAWVVVAVSLAAVATTWLVLGWPELPDASSIRPDVTVAVAAVGAATAPVVGGASVWLAVVVVLGAAVVGAVLHRRSPSATLGVVTVALVLAGAALAAADQATSVVAWLVGSLVLLLVVRAATHVVLRAAPAGAAVVLVVSGLVAATDLAGGTDAVLALVGVVVALAVLGGAGLLVRSDLPTRLTVEATSGVATLVALVAPGSTSELAVRWTVAGVALVALSFVVPGRRLYVWPGLGALVVAYVLLVVDSGFSFVEAYTLPLGAAGLVVGVVLDRRNPRLTTWALLGPGLALSLLPSVPQALADPTGLRALLLGGAALVALVVGVRLGWQAPFVAGCVVVALLLLFNIGPYANAAPRVAVIAAVSAVLLGVGITWEDRLRDGRAIVRFVRAMR